MGIKIINLIVLAVLLISCKVSDNKMEVITFLNVDSRTLYVGEYGRGNKHTIVYFHGGPGASSIDFIGQARALGEKYHVIIFDQYGVLRSDAILENEPFGMIDHINLIDKMREDLGIKSWTLLGHSYGGMLALLYAYTFPEKTDAIIYECPAWDLVLSTKSTAFSLLSYFNRIGLEDAANDCIRIIQKDYTNRRSEAWNDLGTILNQVQDENVRNHLHGITIDEFREAAKYEKPLPEDGWQKNVVHTQKLIDACEIFNENLPYLKEINKPSLLLVGKFDPVCGEDQREYFRQFAVNSTVVEFLNSGHFPRVEEPQKYTEIIINFLDNILK